RHVALPRAQARQRLEPPAERPARRNHGTVGLDLPLRADGDQTLQPAPGEGLLHRLDEAQCQVGVSVREELVGGWSQAPKLCRAAHRPRLFLALDELLFGERVEMLA